MNEDKLTRKATFRSIRERLGLSQYWLAGELGIREVTLRHWESPSTRLQPSEDGMELLLELEENFDNGIYTAVEVVLEQTASLPVEISTVDLKYYATQDRYDELHPNEHGCYGYANAITREVKHQLELKGYNVRIAYA